MTDDGVITLGSEIEVPYYMPILADHRDQNSIYDLSKSVDCRFYAMLDSTNRSTSVRRLKTDVKMTRIKAGYLR